MNNHTNNGHTQTSLALQTVPVRIHSFLYEKVKECVAMENDTKPQHEREMGMADFIRLATAERVAKILKEDVSTLPPVIRGRGGSYVSQAAKKAGISTKEFEAIAIEATAMLALGYDPKDLMAKLTSGEIQAIGATQPRQIEKPKSGQHQIQTLQVASGGRSARRTA
jgi:hypothetical protein